MNNITIDDNFLTELFSRYLFDKSTPHWCIVYKDKIINIEGKMFFNSKQQATKAFYNTFRWRVNSTYVRINHLQWSEWRDVDRSELWKVFKSTVKNDLKIVEIH